MATLLPLLLLGVLFRQCESWTHNRWWYRRCEGTFICISFMNPDDGDKCKYGYTEAHGGNCHSPCHENRHATCECLSQEEARKRVEGNVGRDLGIGFGVLALTGIISGYLVREAFKYGRCCCCRRRKSAEDPENGQGSVAGERHVGSTHSMEMEAYSSERGVVQPLASTGSREPESRCGCAVFLVILLIPAAVTAVVVLLVADEKGWDQSWGSFTGFVLMGLLDISWPIGVVLMFWDLGGVRAVHEQAQLSYSELVQRYFMAPFFLLSPGVGLAIIGWAAERKINAGSYFYYC